MTEYHLFSDGGGQRQNTAGAGCIIRYGSNPVLEHKYVGFLGGATNNEAEIIAGLIGFSLLRGLLADNVSKIELEWCCDSEYVLKSATGYIKSWLKNGWKTASKAPVKNQGLWRAYLRLSDGFLVKPVHVRGHTGHPENEACDTASTWARENAEQYLDDHPGGGDITIDDGVSDSPWRLVDCREFLSKMRKTEPLANECFHLMDVIKSNSVSGTVVKSTKSANSNLKVVMQLLLSAEEKAVSLPDIGTDLAGDIRGLTEKYFDRG